VYFDDKSEIVGINVIRSDPDSKSQSSAKKLLMQFHDPVALSPHAKHVLEGGGEEFNGTRCENRMRPVTLEALTIAGCRRFTWIYPYEKLPDIHAKQFPLGAFAYFFDEEGLCLHLCFRSAGFRA
jgi:hypothetical protein